MLSFTVILVYLSAFAIATPLDVLTSSIEARADTCVAVFRKSKQPASLKERGSVSLDDYFDAESNFEKRTFVKNAQCDTCGSFSKPLMPAYSQDNVSWQSCANWCKCTLDRANCQTFRWEEYQAMPGLGTCYIYPKSLRYMGFAPAAGGEGQFYERGCFRKITQTMPPPYQTTARRSTPTKAPLAKREDVDEKFWALVLAEA